MNLRVSSAAAIILLVGTVHSAGAGEPAWRLKQPTGETSTLTITGSTIQIASGYQRLEIPIGSVRSVRVSKRYLNPIEKAEGWFPNDSPRSGASLPIEAVASDSAAALAVVFGGGILAAASVASLLDPETFIHILWQDGDDVWQSESIRTGFFTPFIQQRLRAVGLSK